MYSHHKTQKIKYGGNFKGKAENTAAETQFYLSSKEGTDTFGLKSIKMILFFFKFFKN